ncbi:MAG: arylsulfatase [Pirellulaceae bacterium]|nr:arylsulfatase [Pirellulaceae bacterium]
MNPKNHRLLCRSAVLVLLLLVTVASADDRPNIVLIMADDLGYSDLGCYGSEIETPNLDRLADEGLRFTQFYNNAKCTPSRKTLLTGLYPRQVKEGEMRSVVNVAQVLKTVGYRTLMTGKNDGGIASLPTDGGFDRFYGLNDGASNYFNPGLKRSGEKEPGRKHPNEQRSWAIDNRIIQPFTPEDRNFYATDAFTDAAVRYLDQYGKDDDPFFLYVSYTAPHFPLQAWPKDIAKYRGRYKIGWDAIRQQRYNRLLEMGIIDRQWKLPPRDRHVPKWDDVKDKDSRDLEMAVYAAMIDRMDQGIGRIMAKVRQLGIEENTLLLFLSDNGSCAEDYKAFDATANEVPPGPMESYRTLGVAWANASNTPFRKYKWWNHEGGVSTPLIAYWPDVIQDGGRISHQIGHIMDIMVTCLNVAGVRSPVYSNSHQIQSLEGRSLLPIFQGEQRQNSEFFHWRFGGSGAVRKGKWKLISADTNPRTGIDFFKDNGDNSKRNSNSEMQWELYDMQSDRTETNNVADKYPEITRQLSQAWKQWNRRMENN